MVAYIGADMNLWIAFANGRAPVRVSRDGRSSDAKYAEVQVLIRGWSPDSSKLLFSQEAHFPTGDSMSEGRGLLPPNLDQGLLVYQVREAASNLVPATLVPSDKREFWSPDSRSILQGARVTGAWELTRTNLADGESSIFAQLPYGEYSQPSFSADGSRLTLYSSADGQVVVFDMKGQKIRGVSPLGAPGEFYFPALSPNGQRIAYSRAQKNETGDERHEWIMRELAAGTTIESHVVLSGSERAPKQWLDGKRVGAALNDNRVAVWDVETKELSVYDPAKDARRSP